MKQLLRETHRGSIWQVLLVYVGVSWAVTSTPSFGRVFHDASHLARSCERREPARPPGSTSSPNAGRVHVYPERDARLARRTEARWTIDPSFACTRKLCFWL